MQKFDSKGKLSTLVDVKESETMDLESTLPGRIERAHMNSFTISIAGRPSNKSDEEIIRLETRCCENGRNGHSRRLGQCIRVTEEYRVTQSSQ